MFPLRLRPHRCRGRASVHPEPRRARPPQVEAPDFLSANASPVILNEATRLFLAHGFCAPGREERNLSGLFSATSHPLLYGFPGGASRDVTPACSNQSQAPAARSTSLSRPT